MKKLAVVVSKSLFGKTVVGELVPMGGKLEVSQHITLNSKQIDQKIPVNTIGVIEYTQESGWCFTPQTAQ
jgi:hypothetical protein